MTPARSVVFFNRAMAPGDAAAPGLDEVGLNKVESSLKAHLDDEADARSRGCVGSRLRCDLVSTVLVGVVELGLAVFS